MTEIRCVIGQFWKVGDRQPEWVVDAFDNLVLKWDQDSVVLPDGQICEPGSTLICQGQVIRRWAEVELHTPEEAASKMQGHRVAAHNQAFKDLSASPLWVQVNTRTPPLVHVNGSKPAAPGTICFLMEGSEQEVLDVKHDLVKIMLGRSDRLPTVRPLDSAVRRAWRTSCKECYLAFVPTHEGLLFPDFGTAEALRVLPVLDKLVRIVKVVGELAMDPGWDRSAFAYTKKLLAYHTEFDPVKTEYQLVWNVNGPELFWPPHTAINAGRYGPGIKDNPGMNILRRIYGSDY